jgi:hypothetical protein
MPIGRLLQRRGWLAAFILSASYLPAAAGQEHSIAVTQQRDLLSLQASNAPVAEVMEQLGRHAGFTTRVIGTPVARVTLTLANQPLEELIRQLTRGYSAIILYHPAASGRAPAALRIKAVWLVGDKEASGGAIILSPAPPPDHNPRENLRQLAALENSKNDTEIGYLKYVLMQRDDPASRIHTIDAIVASGADEAADIVALALGDADIAVRRHVVERLRDLGNPRAVQILGQIVLGDAAPEVRRAAVTALAANGGEAPHHFLVAASRDRDEQVRRLAQGSLAR